MVRTTLAAGILIGLYTLLPVRDGGSVTQGRFLLSYAPLRPGMRVSAVEVLMGRYYVVSGPEFAGLVTYYQRTRVDPSAGLPTARPLPRDYTGRLWYLHDIQHGAYNSDFVLLEFKKGVLVRKRFAFD